MQAFWPGCNSTSFGYAALAALSSCMVPLIQGCRAHGVVSFAQSRKKRSTIPDIRRTNFIEENGDAKRVFTRDIAPMLRKT